MHLFPVYFYAFARQRLYRHTAQTNISIWLLSSLTAQAHIAHGTIVSYISLQAKAGSPACPKHNAVHHDSQQDRNKIPPAACEQFVQQPLISVVNEARRSSSLCPNPSSTVKFLPRISPLSHIPVRWNKTHVLDSRQTQFPFPDPSVEVYWPRWSRSVLLRCLPIKVPFWQTRLRNFAIRQYFRR